jgi:muramoyltetrapeptide carboxypeptidase
MVSPISRRGLLRGAAAVAAGGAVTGALAGGTEAVAAPAGPPVQRPRALKAGDRVRIVAPARPGDARLDIGIGILRGWDLEVEVATHVYDQFGYLAGTDADRLADLNAALRDPGVRGVFAARGGYGCQRIADGVDVAAVRRDPKVFVGFSDITSLHGKLSRVGLATIYGPTMTWTASLNNPASMESLRRAVMTTDPIVITRDPAEPSAAVDVPGKATGTLRGGNLTMLDTGVGTGDFQDFAGAILLFEDVDEQPYSYDRMLTHLRRSGALAKIKGIAIGNLTNATGPAGEWDAATAIRDRVSGLGVPVLGGLRIGHGSGGQLTVPLGVSATIDTTAGTLTVQPGVRAGY